MLLYTTAQVQRLLHIYSDAWGNHSVSYTNGGGSTGAQYNPFRYRGYYYDTDLGMYYLQSRYYDPNTCRFINADGQLNTDHILGTNLYAYCYNNPVMYVDYTGCEPDWWLLFEGSMFVLMGVVTVTAVFATGGSCLPLVQLAYLGLISSGVLATSIGASEIYESFTGDNPIKDSVGEQAYDTLKYGSMLVMSMGASIIEYGTAISVCFVAGTIVKASEGDVPIENIQVGDYVYAHNPETGETELKPVVNTFVNEATELVHVFADGEEIICTNEHPFYSPAKGWIEACKLRAGDILVSLNGEYIIVEQVQHEILEAPIKVYNFEVEDFHTYFVGDGDGVLVHNECGPNGTYVDASYHTKGNSVKSPRPINGQAALDNSIQISPNSPRRIGVSDGQFVVLDQTSVGIFHGHVRTWNELTNQMQSALYKWGVVTKNGKFR